KSKGGWCQGGVFSWFKYTIPNSLDSGSVPLDAAGFHSLGKSPFPPRVVHTIAVAESSRELLFKKLKRYVPWHKMDSLIIRNRRDLMFYKRRDVHGIPRF